MGDGIMDGYPIIQDQTSPNLAHIPTTNNAVPSEVFTAWGVTAVTVTTNTVVSPDGTQNASTLTPTAVSGIHIISTTGTNTVAMSIYAKQNGYTRFRFNSLGKGSNLSEQALVWSSDTEQADFAQAGFLSLSPGGILELWSLYFSRFGQNKLAGPFRSPDHIASLQRESSLKSNSAAI